MRNLAVLLILLLTVNVAFSQPEKKDTFVKEGSVIVATLYHDNGTIAQEGTYNLEGKLHGVWVSYDEDGKKTAVANYENGRKVGTWFFWTNDKLHEVSYEDSQMTLVNSWGDKETRIVSYR